MGIAHIHTHLSHIRQNTLSECLMFQLSEHSPFAIVGGTEEYITQATAQTHTVWNVFLTAVNLMFVQPPTLQHPTLPMHLTFCLSFYRLIY